MKSTRMICADCYLDYPFSFESGSITPPASKMKFFVCKEKHTGQGFHYDSDNVNTKEIKSRYKADIYKKPLRRGSKTDVTSPQKTRPCKRFRAPKEPIIRDLMSPLPRHVIKIPNEKSPRRPVTAPASPSEPLRLKKTYKSENIPPPGCKINWNHYHRLKIIYQFLDSLETTYPSLCSVSVIGRSLEGRALKTVRISNSNADNCAVWIDAGIHAREWIGPAVNTYIANYIASHFKKLPKYVTNKDWYFMPVANPDGYEYTHTVNRMWRKNKAWVGGKCVGVDLNRNFSFGWGGCGSSDDPHNNFYRGAHPFSEPESCAIRDFLSRATMSFKVYITLHSYGEMIIFPFASQETLCPGYIRLLEGATVMSKAIYKTNGNTYKVGISRDVLYIASGTSNDFSHGVLGIPYCYLIELRSKKDRFKVPMEEIEESGNEILNSMFALMEFVDQYPSEKLIAENNIYAHVARVL